MYNLKKTVSLLLAVVMLAALFVGCVTQPPMQTEPPTEEPPTEGPQNDALYYTLTKKTVDGIDITARFLLNLLTLSDGKALWTEITATGTETQEGTYEISDNVMPLDCIYF